jgi:endoglucanase
VYLHRYFYKIKKSIKNIQMKKKIIYVIAGVFITLFSIISCKKTQVSAELSVANITDTIPPGGGTESISFTCNAAWSIDTAGIKWLQVSQVSGNSGTATINFTAAANTSGISRSVVLQLNAANGQARRITVLQAPVIFPSYNTSPKAPDATGMGSTAMQINANIKLGMNIWNSMEAPGGETGWGNPVITQSLIDSLKKAGFNAIRIPCGYWTSHTNHTTGEIDAAWLNRIKEVIQYCVNDGMYVLLNDHHDGFMDCTKTGANLDTAKAIQKAIWEQVATKMRDFDEHVMFASSNEPNATDLPTSINLKSYHQIFINAVRSTGGKNAYRTLVIQAPSTSLDLATYFGPDGLPGMPKDLVPDKLMVEFHWYSPPNFCLLTSDASWGKEWRFWGANFHSPTDLTHNSIPGVEEGWLDSTMQWAKKYFVSKNIPMLMGEFGVENHAVNIIGNPQDSILSLNSRAHFFKVLVESARANGVSSFLWAGVINRQTLKIDDKQALDSLRKGAGY